MRCRVDSDDEIIWIGRNLDARSFGQGLPNIFIRYLFPQPPQDSICIHLGPVSERVAINRKFYTICHWATIDIHRTINRNPLWNGGPRQKYDLIYRLSTNIQYEKSHWIMKLYLSKIYHSVKTPFPSGPVVHEEKHVIMSWVPFFHL